MGLKIGVDMSKTGVDILKSRGLTANNRVETT